MAMLPVDAVTTELNTALQRRRNAVLQAPPGAGKTTRIPLALLEAGWLQGQRIVMLEPRRLAARAAARYMARQLGEDVGGRVGYRVRLDTRVSARTRIEVVTEGVLTRMLQSDPSLEGVGIVIFDEFHERSLHADLGLALTLQARALFCPELAILVMSATLQSERVAALLGGAPVITSEGRTFPVHIEHLSGPGNQRIEAAVTRCVLQALDSSEGDVLVFLPGRAEIQRTQTRLLDAQLPADTSIYPLFGDLSAEDQDRAIAPSPPGRRKIVLATSIAETSLTIEGVRVVIDSGLMRVPRFSARTGMTRLETVRVTRASAHQRCGRAGRTAPGECYRLWTEAEHTALLEHGEPEIMQADLAPLALDLAAWGVNDPYELSWLDAPPASAYAQATELLRELGAFDASGALTAHGRRMAMLPLHPRLAHMVLRGQELGLGALAAELAALLGERDVLRDTADPDIGLRLLALHGRTAPVVHSALQRVRAEASEIRRMIGAGAKQGSFAEAGLLLAHAYPDRIARLRSGTRGRFLLRHGRGATIDQSAPLAASEFMVAAQVDDRGAETRVFLAAQISEQEIAAHFSDQFEITRQLEWDRQSSADSFVIRAREQIRLGAIVMSERKVQVGPEERAVTVLEAVRREGLAALPWSDEARRLRQRLAFLHSLDEDWPDVSDDALLARLEEWLAPALLADGARADLNRALEQLLDWSRRARLDELAPTHLTVPTGSRITLDYSDPAAPTLAVRLQEVFGWLETPRIGGGRVPIVMHLLSPAQRPVQVTRDLASFWRTAYFDVRKDLKGRYPKHYWPDDPLSAAPTRGTGRRRD